MKTIGLIVAGHCWVSGAITFGIAIDYWFDANDLVVGFAMGVALLGSLMLANALAKGAAK